MPVYRTAPDRSLEDVIGAVESKGEKVVAMEHQGGQWVVVTRMPENDTGRAWLPTNLGATEKR